MKIGDNLNAKKNGIRNSPSKIDILSVFELIKQIHWSKNQNKSSDQTKKGSLWCKQDTKLEVSIKYFATTTNQI